MVQSSRRQQPQKFVGLIQFGRHPQPPHLQQVQTQLVAQAALTVPMLVLAPLLSASDSGFSVVSEPHC